MIQIDGARQRGCPMNRGHGFPWQLFPNSTGQFVKFCSSPWQTFFVIPNFLLHEVNDKSTKMDDFYSTVTCHNFVSFSKLRSRFPFVDQSKLG